MNIVISTSMNEQCNIYLFYSNDYCNIDKQYFTPSANNLHAFTITDMAK